MNVSFKTDREKEWTENPTIPGKCFYDWLRDVLDRYDAALKISKGRDPLAGVAAVGGGPRELFTPSREERFGLADPVDYFNVPKFHGRFVCESYEPSISSDCVYFQNTSFTNRMRSVDWNYHLQTND